MHAEATHLLYEEARVVSVTELRLLQLLLGQQAAGLVPERWEGDLLHRTQQREGSDLHPAEMGSALLHIASTWKANRRR